MACSEQTFSICFRNRIEQQNVEHILILCVKEEDGGGGWRGVKKEKKVIFTRDVLREKFISAIGCAQKTFYYNKLSHSLSRFACLR